MPGTVHRPLELADLVPMQYDTLTVDEDSRYASGDYAALNPTWHSEDSSWKAAHVAKIIEHNDLEFETCVDVGCGAGGVVQKLSEQFPDVRFAGYDISPQVAAMWDRNSGVRFVIGDPVDESTRYTLTLILYVIEHVDDYLGFLRRLSMLSDSYIFHIPLEMNVSAIVRDRHMYSRQTVGHLHYFSRATALATLTDCGYTVVDECFTYGALELESSKTRRTRMLNPVRRLAARISPALTAKTLGGCSLLVLANGPGYIRLDCSGKEVAEEKDSESGA